MKTSTLLALASLAWPLLGLAQAANPPPVASGTVADPAAPVPPLHYRSALQAGPQGVIQERDDWKAANARVGQYPRGHHDILKAEEAQASAAPAASTAPPATAPLHEMHMPMPPQRHGHPPASEPKAQPH